MTMVDMVKVNCKLVISFFRTPPPATSHFISTKHKIQSLS